MRLFTRLMFVVLISAALVNPTVARCQALGAMTCSQAPCIFAPTQASEGGALVNDAPIVVNPLDRNRILVGSNDFNCPFPSTLGFHLSQDGGSTWNVKCLDTMTVNSKVYWPSGPDPSVGYDTKGAAYIAGDYADSESGDTGFIAFEKSQDNVNWSQPAIALYVSPDGGIGYAAYSWLTIDTNLQSPHHDNVYVSAIVIGGDAQQYNQVVVSHSTDSGAHWKAVRVTRPQLSPIVSRYTSMSVGKDGAVYLAWMYCNSGPYFCNNNKGYMLFSKSGDGGDTWTAPILVAVVNLNGEGLPNSDVGVDNYPAIAVDNSSGPHASSLYVSM